MKPPLSRDVYKRKRIDYAPTTPRKKFVVTAVLIQVIEAGDVGEAVQKIEGEVLFGKLGNLPQLKNVYAYELSVD